MNHCKSSKGGGIFEIFWKIHHFTLWLLRWLWK